MSLRIGYGCDVHRLVAGRKLMLGGVHIPFDQGLDGHSDADVLLHAICDALLGAAGLGDIGQHFPDTDPSLQNISSLLLLERTAGLVQKEGYAVANVDATLVLQSPKIAPFVQSMRRNISKSLDIAERAVSVKATTNEGLGALGRNEGCAAVAVALLIPRRGR